MDQEQGYSNKNMPRLLLIQAIIMFLPEFYYEGISQSLGAVYVSNNLYLMFKIKAIILPLPVSQLTLPEGKTIYLYSEQAPFGTKKNKHIN